MQTGDEEKEEKEEEEEEEVMGWLLLQCGIVLPHLKYSVATSGQSHLGEVRMNQRLAKRRLGRCVYRLKSSWT